MSTTTLEYLHYVNGALADATTVVLSDPTDAYGVKRTDTAAIVVANGAAMTRVGVGRYHYTLTDPALGLTYIWYAEAGYGGFSYHHGPFTTTGASTEWDGYYVDAALARNIAGVENLAAYSRLDSDETTEDPVILQRYADKVDRYVNYLAKYVYGWDADDVPIATTHDLFGQIQDAASTLFVPEIYGARGMLDPQNDSEAGKMLEMRTRADAYLRELLATKGTVAADDVPGLTSGLSLGDQFGCGDLTPDPCCERRTWRGLVF